MAVSTTTGVPSSSGRARISRTRASPSRTGIITSLMTRSGRSRSAFSRPFWPSSAEATRNSGARVAATKRFMSGLSSTTRTRGRSSREEAGGGSLGSRRLSSASRTMARIITAESSCEETTAPGGAWAGSSTRSSAPPSGASPMVTAPRISSTKSRTMARPRPVPPKRRVAPPSSWRKRSKTVCRSAEGTPGPLSAISTTTRLSGSSRAEKRTRPPTGVNLNALESRLRSARWSLPASTSAGIEIGASMV